MTSSQADGYRAGFVTFLGRPNVGKSTLTNALVGEKIAITSPKPQTTRRAIRGIVHRPHGQLILVDAPGVHRPRTLLGERLNDLVAQTLRDVDVAAFCIPADQPLGPGDRFIAEQLDQVPGTPAVALVTKAETVSRSTLAERLLEVDALRDWRFVIPVSAVAGTQLEPLVDELIALMPPSPPLYPPETRTEEGFSERAAELIREAVLAFAEQELPHSVAVTVDDLVPGADDAPAELYASIVVERDSQKGIVIGRGGARLAEVRRRSQREIATIAGHPVHLNLHVRVAREWQRDPKQLGRLGF